jgi:hypothetical protein
MTPTKDEALISLITELVGTVALYDMKKARRLGKRVHQALAAPPVQEPFDHQQAASTALRKSINRSVVIAKNTVPTLQKRPPNCGTGYCSCVECVMEPAPVQEPVNGDKVKQLVSKCTHRDVDGNWYVDGVQLVHETCFALDAIKRKSTTPAAAQPAQPAVPDAITDSGENPKYRAGWNECRETMLEMMKARTL